MENDNDFITVTTKDNLTAYIRKTDVNAVEVIPATSRAEGFIKVYISGYHFSLKMSLEDFEALMRG